MLFNSIEFLIFFPLVSLAYFALPHAWRWVLLLIASCWFYMAFIPVFVLILVALILIDFTAAIWMESESGTRRRALLVASILANVGMLGVFKYFNFFNSNIAALADWLGLPYPIHNLSIILPIGLSFHTFQSMSYVIEVYRGRYKAERHLGIYALYVMFYPQLVAGPIERPQNLLGQFREEHSFDRARLIDGLKLMLVGFFKKVAIADTLALIVNQVYQDPAAFSPAAVLAAVYAFTFQIYYDFSGYTDIARGAARAMGFELMVNFDRPYASRSVSEFWRRWHISLSSWFRDYVYIPLGGNRSFGARRYANLVSTFVISGLWHGANWTFVAWGALHGAALVLSKFAVGENKEATPAGLTRSFISWFLTFHFAAFAWIFFRAPSMTASLAVIRKLFQGAPTDRGVSAELLLASAALVTVMELADWLWRAGRLQSMAPGIPLVRQSLAYAWVFAAVAIIAARITFDATPQTFIYFQF